MTAIVGAARPGRIVLAADSCWAAGDSAGTTPTSKLRRSGAWIYGMAGAWLALTQAQSVPLRSCSTPIEAWRDLCDGVPAEGWEALLAHPDHGLYYASPVSGILSCGLYGAIGSGGPTAIGALHALRTLVENPADWCRRALCSAAAHSPHVRPPWRLMSVTGAS